MKFSHSIQFNAVPDWANHYIAYSNLKKLIYQLEKQTKDAVHFSLIPSAAGLDQVFQRALDGELEKITSFYQLKELEIYGEISELLQSKEPYEAPDLGQVERLEHGRPGPGGTSDGLHNGDVIASTDSLYYAVQQFGTLYSDVTFEKRVISLFVSLCELKSFVQLNRTGFTKVLKKYDKICDRSLMSEYIEKFVIPAYPFRPETIERIEEKIGSMEQTYADITTHSDIDLAKRELRLHLREHVVWERNVVWREMIGIERRAASTSLGTMLLGTNALAETGPRGDGNTGDLTRKITDVSPKATENLQGRETMRQEEPNVITGSLYSRLSFVNYEIRLLTLLPDPDNSSVICCTLEHASLIEPPEYKALSYCWGPATVTQTIKVNGFDTQATTNLVAALRQLRSQGSFTLWVDAVCINQTDVEERALQVQHMRSIFSQATEVIAWVGLEDENSVKALDFIEQLGQKPSELESFIQNLGQFDKSTGWKACEIFFSRPYWRRVWVIQEIAVAPRVLVQCGERIVPWADIKQALAFTSLVDFDRIRNSIIERQLGTLLETLYDTRTSLATDARDKVYAILGLTTDGHNIIPLPNYKQPVETVLKQMTKSFLLRDSCLDIITLRRPDRVDCINLPSWVPDWTELAGTIRPWHVQHLKQTTKNDRSHQRSRRGAIDSDHHRPSFGFHDNILWVTGRVVDIIDKLSTSLYEAVPTYQIVDSNTERTLYLKTEREVENATLFDVSGSDVLPLNYLPDLLSPEGRKLLKHIPQNLQQWLNINEDFLLSTIRDAEKQGSNLEEGFEQLKTAMSRLEKVLKCGTRLFRTVDGFLGIAHVQARKGDHVCLIRDCRLLVILRKTGDDWNVIGEAYSHQYQDLELKDEAMVKFSLR